MSPTTANAAGPGSHAPVTVERELAVKLTEPELLERGDRQADCEIEIEGLKLERKRLNGEITRLATERARLAHIVDSKQEDRSVSCTWRASFETNSFVLTRNDTGEQIEARPMTAAERQGSLFGLDGGEADDTDYPVEDGEGPGDEDEDEDDTVFPIDEDALPPAPAVPPKRKPGRPRTKGVTAMWPPAAAAHAPAPTPITSAKPRGRRPKPRPAQ